MPKIFKSVKPIRAKRNKFDLSFESAVTTEFGRLTPILTQECIPGDIYRIRPQILIRMSPMFAPAFSRVNAYLHYFFFPHRLGNDDFEPFITGAEDGQGTITNRNGLTRTAERLYLAPYNMLTELETAGDSQRIDKFKALFKRSTLFDYLGFPTADFDETCDMRHVIEDFSEHIDLSPFVAFAQIYNDYYRDQNFEEEVDILKDCYGEAYTCLRQKYGLNVSVAADKIMSLLSVRQRNWEKDYFTSSLPWPQRGTDTTIGENDTDVYPSDPNAHHVFPVQSNSVDVDAQNIASMLKVNGNIVASVNDFRRAMAIQKLKEAEARFGARFFEYIRGFFGVKVSDARLQRPEFIGGTKVPIQFGEVLQTSETNITPQASYAGRGIGGGMTKTMKYKCKEHGWLIGIISIMPKPFYAQGWPRKFSRFDRFDFYNPLFAHLGEQEVKQKELAFFWQTQFGVSYSTPAIFNMNNKLFGYAPRYAEMRYNPSEVHGDFRTSLKDWHTARVIEPNGENAPSMLNKEFLEVDSESANRIFNYRQSDYDHFWINLYHDISAIRPMPKFGTPLI